MKNLFLILALFVALTTQTVMAQVPNSLSYQGYLEDSGSAVNGSKDLTFKIYDAATGGGIVWQNTMNAVNVDNGVFSITLSSGSPDLGTVAFDKPYWISVTVDGTELDRVPLTSTPYSLRAKIANDVVDGKAVKSLNGLTGAVKIEAGANVTVAQSGNSVTISATGGGAPTGGSGGGGVSGSGAENTLAKWGANNTLTESKIVENIQNNSVDINVPVNIITNNADALIVGNSVYGLSVGRNRFKFASPSGSSGESIFTAGIGSGNSLRGINIKGDGSVEIKTTGSGTVFSVGSGTGSSSIGLGLTGSGNFAVGKGGVTSNFGGIFVESSGDFWAGRGSVNSINSWTGLNVTRGGDAIVTGRMGIRTKSFSSSDIVFQVANNALVVNNRNQVMLGTSRAPSSGLKLWVEGQAGGKQEWSTSSDARFKTNIQTIPHALDKVRALRGVSFDRTDIDDTGEQIGFVAQEVEPVVPQAVDTDDEGYKSVKYASMVSVLVEAMKEMDSEMKQLKARIAELEAGK